MEKKLQDAKESKTKVERTWLQCQIGKPEWDILNARRLALKLLWADIIVPGTRHYLDKLEATPADASVEAPAVTTIENKAPEKSRASKVKRHKKASAPEQVVKESKASDATTTSTEESDTKGQGHDK